MKKFAGLMIVLSLFAGSLLAGQSKAGIAGKWTVTVAGEGRGGHQFPTVEMELEQNGKKITGNFLIPEHGDLPLEGEFVDGKLTLHATEDGFMKLDLTATLKENGQFVGKMDGTMGERSWTAERAKGR